MRDSQDREGSISFRTFAVVAFILAVASMILRRLITWFRKPQPPSPVAAPSRCPSWFRD